MNESGVNHLGPARQLNLVYILGTYPGLTTTFIDREIQALRRWGVSLRIVSIRRPSAGLSEEQKEIQQGVVYLLPVIWLAFLGSHLRFVFLRPRAYFGALTYLLAAPHPGMKSRLKTLLHFAEGVYAASIIQRGECDHLHAHFVDRAATVALVTSRLLGRPYSLSAHANDIYVNPVLLAEKCSEAKFVATCTRYNQEHLSLLLAGRLNGKVKCIYHGLDLEQYLPQPAATQDKPVLLAVGQLKEKKGFPDLLKACRLLLDRGYDVDCRIVGEGPLRSQLQAHIRQLALKEVVTLYGALQHPEVIAMYREASIFVLPAVQGVDGDRDGIPNVILEAMAMQLPVVSTCHSGIPEVVEDGVDGLLVPPGDEVALADALAKLLDEAQLRRHLGEKGRLTVKQKFNLEQNSRHLLEEFTR